jgi:uncharacterized protein (TIRG00374 family)
MSKVSIVIPAHNEEENIPVLMDVLIPTLESYEETKNFEIVIVNDNSKDGTGSLIDSLAMKDTRIKPVHRITTPGFGNAVKTGLKNATGDILIPVMADLSDDPHDIAKMVKKIEEGYDIAYGSRFCPGGSTNGYPWKKMIANRTFNNSVRLLFGIRHKDITNAFKAYRREVLDAIGIDNLEANGFDLTVEIPLKAHILGFKSAEVPVSWTERKKGEAKLKLSQNGTKYGKRLLKMFIMGNMASIGDILSITVKGSWLHLIAAFIVGVLLLIGIFSITGYTEVFQILSHINLMYVALACTAIFIAFILRTWRWSVLLRSSGHRIHPDSGFKCIMFGWFINYLLPLRVGDLVRAVALKSVENTPISTSLFTIVVERAMDMLMLTILLVAAILLISIDVTLIEIALIALIISISLIILIWLIYRYDNIILKVTGTRFGNLAGALATFKQGVGDLRRNPEAVALCLMISLPVWLFDIFCVYFSTRAINVDISYGVVTISGITAFIAQAIPATPAGIGIQEGTIVGVMTLFGIDAKIGMSISLVDHFARALIIFVFGAISIVHIGLNSRSYFIEKKKKQGVDGVNEQKPV